MNDNICYFIHTCDDYEKFWNGWHESYRKFWPKDLDWKVYFVNEEKDIYFNDDFVHVKTFKSKKEWVTETREVDSKGEKLLTTGSMKQVDYGWSDRLIMGLENIKEDYLLFAQEDMWLKHKVDSNLFQDAFRFVERNDINVLRIHRFNRIAHYGDGKNYLKTDFFIGDNRVLKVDKKAGYLMNHQPAIWKKSFLQEVLIKGESFRDNEFEGTERIREYNDPKIYHLNYDWCFNFPSAASAGEFFQEHGSSIEQEWRENTNDICVEQDYDLKRMPFIPKSKGLKLSLVTSCYRAEHFIEQLSESILQQSYDNWEWIIADDFSDDNTLVKLNELQAKDSRIRLVYPKYKKEIWWNPQIHATGDIVCHIDSDDRLLPNALEHIDYYFNLFPEAVLMHFNANKYHNVLPQDSKNIFEHYKDNVYMTRDNDSFLEGFEKLWPNRTNIFGYLRVFRNLPGLHFPVHEDGDACSSNDGQWLLMLEERGKWITIPRTNYLAREHGDSENFRKWNPRGEAQLAIDARKRRKEFELEYPRNIKYFDDIYDSAEALYTSRLNYETSSKNISFLNYDYENNQKEKVKKLFYDHDLNFNEISKTIDYFVIKINLTTTSQDIINYCNTIEQVNNDKYEIILFSDNAHLHTNNRTNTDQIHAIKEAFVQCGYHFSWFIQDNKFHANSYKIPPQLIEVQEPEKFIIEEEEKVFKIKDKLKIMQIHVGCGLAIPPKSYGGLEEVVYQYSRVAKHRGHDVALKWLDDINQNDLEEYDVFHNHTGGFFDLTHDRCIPYIFTMHDTFAKINGKGSWFHNTNNETIKNSLFTLIPTNDMIGWFNYPEKMRKLDHGVDCDFYFPVEKSSDIRLCCVGGGDDRKGFHLAIQAAHKMNLPITIIGPESIHDDYNKIYYNIIDECKNDINIELVGNVEKPKLRELLNEHHIIIHPATIETGQPCLAVLEAMACGLPCVGTMQDDVNIPGLFECTRDIDTIVNGIETVINDYDEQSKKARSFARERDWNNIFDKLESYYYEARELKYTKPFSMKDRLIFAYNHTKKVLKEPEIEKNNFILDMKTNPYLQILGDDQKEYDVSFLNKNTNQVLYQHTIGNNCWCASTIEYYVPWEIVVTDKNTGRVAYHYDMDLSKEAVYIHFDSGALGDNLAWIGSVNQFQLKHKCKVYCFTFFNHLFRERYPNIEFMDDHTSFSTSDKFKYSYWIGWLTSNYDKCPVDTQNVPLQKVCSSILGLDYIEERAKIAVNEIEAELKAPYVCIGMQSTAQAKYWNYGGGWDEIVKYLKKLNYDVVCIDKHQIFGSGKYMNSAPEGVIHRHDRTLDQTIATVNGCEFFIGLGSGLSWLAWSLEKPVVLISGFSNPDSEFQIDCERIHNSDVCNSCYNRHTFDPNKWDWCPDNNDFICTKSITPEMVKNSINNIIKDKNNII